MRSWRVMMLSCLGLACAAHGQTNFVDPFLNPVPGLTVSVEPGDGIVQAFHDAAGAIGGSRDIAIQGSPDTTASVVFGPSDPSANGACCISADGSLTVVIAWDGTADGDVDSVGLGLDLTVEGQDRFIVSFDPDGAIPFDVTVGVLTESEQEVTKVGRATNTFRFSEFDGVDFTNVGNVFIRLNYFTNESIKSTLRTVYTAAKPIDVFSDPQTMIIEADPNLPFDAVGQDDPDAFGGARKGQVFVGDGDASFLVGIGGGPIDLEGFGNNGFGGFNLIWDGTSANPDEFFNDILNVDLTDGGTNDRIDIVWGDIEIEGDELVRIEIIDVNGNQGGVTMPIPAKGPAVQSFEFSDVEPTFPGLPGPDLTQVGAVALATAILPGTQFGVISVGPAPVGAPICPADCDLNGVLNILDFVCFQNLFWAGDPSTDCNGDGVLNMLDFVCFQGWFQAGCP